MTLYISGKITGDKHYKRKFAKAKARLLKKGFDVISPADISGYKFLTYGEFLHIDYALNHVEIPLEGIERMCFMLIKPQLDAALN